MSRPQFPLPPDITRQDAINQVISSIASEELALSHILNAEGEKIQYAVGTLPGLPESATLPEIADINQSAVNMMGTVLENQVLLTGKLSDALRAPVFFGPTGPTGPAGDAGSDMGPTGPMGSVGDPGVVGQLGLPGAVGPLGPPGDAGDAGDAGALGPTGAAGAAASLPPPTATVAFGANTASGLVTVLVLGTALTFPSVQLMSPDILLGSGNTTFTVNTAGYYRISYHVNTTAGVLLGTRLVVNGANLPQGTLPPVLTTSQFYNEVEIGLAANSTVQLQMYAPLIAGTATLLGGGVGASLMIIRLS